MSNHILIKADKLSRYYGENCAVNDISFELKRGDVLGFLGPNGAGKTTTMRMLSGNLAPSKGQIIINGVDIIENPKEAKAELGYLPEQPPLYKELTVNEYLHYCAQLNRIKRNNIKKALDNAKDRCGLAEMENRLIGNLSKGYQQRVGIAQAIIHSPSIIILDEPTVGLDPIQIREIRNLIKELGQEHGVILSTHILPEVQATCNRVQIINKGKLVFNDEVANLAKQVKSSSLIIGLHQPPTISELEALPGITSVERLQDDRLRFYYGNNPSPAEMLAEKAVKDSWGLYELTPDLVSLEKIFVDLTCKEPPVQ
ncbi:MAG: ABC transporter ATP-binding protein [Gammaproteobacteria bacterium]|nr:ABC transporter ATP-binding protein [Gammaproteobacteria bacterium]MDH5593077.1 ABC transporter ATP-binding protein [Gammaproteobacteria bacterium]